MAFGFFPSSVLQLQCSLSQCACNFTILSFFTLCHRSFPTLQFSEPRGCSWAVSEQVQLNPGARAGFSRSLQSSSSLLIQLFAIYLPADQSGTAWELREAMAAQCGYSVTYSTWRSIDIHASALSCHSHLEVSLLQTF